MTLPVTRLAHCQVFVEECAFFQLSRRTDAKVGYLAQQGISKPLIDCFCGTPRLGIQSLFVGRKSVPGAVASVECQ